MRSRRSGRLRCDAAARLRLHPEVHSSASFAGWGKQCLRSDAELIADLFTGSTRFSTLRLTLHSACDVICVPNNSLSLERGLTVDHHGDVHKVDLPAGLHAGLAPVHALVSLGHLMDLQVVVGQHLEPAFTAQARRRGGRTVRKNSV